MAPQPKLRKIAIVGSRSVGKSSLTVQYCEGRFVESYYPTIENTFSHEILYNTTPYLTEIIDTAGQDEYSLLNSKHFIGIHGYMIVYSVASRQSFDMVSVIREKILNQLGVDTVPMTLVGNKVDVSEKKRVVSKEEGERLAKSWGVGFVESSARDNINVASAFDEMITQCEKGKDPDNPTGGRKCVMM